MMKLANTGINCRNEIGMKNILNDMQKHVDGLQEIITAMKHVMITQTCKELNKTDEEPEPVESSLAACVSDDNEPYFGWCDVDGCENESCCGGTAWKKTGYWKVCSKHSNDFRNGKSRPKMKQKSVDRENGRDKTTGYLPNHR